MFLIFDSRYLASVKAYCFQYPLETIEITSYLQLIAEGNTDDKRSGRLYLYFEEEEIKALIFFNNKGIMHFSNYSEKLYSKVDFLKTIHRESPKYVRGKLDEVDRLFYFLQRALKDFSFKTIDLMLYKKNNNRESFDSNIVAADGVDWQKNANFLIEVENYFRSDPLSINYLRQKLKQSKQVDFYFAYREDKILAQIIGEYSNYCYGVIGGLYVNKEARRRGLAKSLLNAAISRYKENNLVPLLYVAGDNQAAIALYQQCGFVKTMEMMEMMVSL